MRKYEQSSSMTVDCLSGNKLIGESSDSDISSCKSFNVNSFSIKDLVSELKQKIKDEKVLKK